MPRRIDLLEQAGSPPPISRARSTQSGRAMPRVGARLHPQPDAPRVVESGTGRVLSGPEMAREKAAGRAAFAAREVRRQLAVRRLLRHAAHGCLARGPGVDGPPASSEMLYLRLHTRLAESTCLHGRGRNFWHQKWEMQRAIAAQVWREYVAARAHTGSDGAR